jgi:teichoic acid transport system ATP-binding protein
LPSPVDEMTDERSSPEERQLAVVFRDVHLTYRIHTDGQTATLRRMIARRFKPRPAREIRALRGVSYDVARGESIGIVGPNGSGKSTMLRVMAGLLPATGGQVLARAKPVLLGVGAALHPELSGRRNIFLGGTALGLSRDEVEEAFESIVEFAGLQEFVDVPLRAYSSGMRARLHFAIASAVTPEILLIDEALVVGDKSFRNRSQARIKELVDAAGTVFIVSHNLGSLREMCSRGLWLQDGILRMDGPIEEVLDAYESSDDER